MDPLAPYRYELPEERIARHPPERRDGGRLMSLGPQGLAHRRVVELPGLLRAGDLLVVNETRVLPARLHGRRSTGGRVEVFLLGAGPGPVRALLRPGKKLRPGERLELDSGAVLLLERFEDGSWLVEASPSPGALMAAEGAMPLPPYLRREALDADRERYQTVFARVDGAVAAPTAGLHLSEEVLAELRARGVGLARITLHVGAGTFRNLRPEELQRGELHPERYEVPEETVSAIRACEGRVIAVGTTVTRTLESACGPDGVPRAGPGVTRLFLREGDPFRCIDGLLTNFHLPASSLLILVCAFAGRERVLAAYDEAIRHGYRFYSYGDAMLLLPGRGAGR